MHSNLDKNNIEKKNNCQQNNNFLHAEQNDLLKIMQTLPTDKKKTTEERE